MKSDGNCPTWNCVRSRASWEGVRGKGERAISGKGCPIRGTPYRSPKYMDNSKQLDNVSEWGILEAWAPWGIPGHIMYLPASVGACCGLRAPSEWGTTVVPE